MGMGEVFCTLAHSLWVVPPREDFFIRASSARCGSVRLRFHCGGLREEGNTRGESVLAHLATTVATIVVGVDPGSGRAVLVSRRTDLARHGPGYQPLKSLLAGPW